MSHKQNEQPENLKKAIVVLGMHRSGTSAIARVINLYGALLPKRLMPAKEGNNQAGFWEPLCIVKIHDELLNSAGSAWDDFSEFPQSWFASSIAGEFKKRMLEALHEDFADAPLFVLKDPRICRLVPFWLDVFQEFRTEPSFVLPVRHPLEVAASLKQRDGFELAKSLLLWLQHVLASERETRNFPRSFISYDKLLLDWQGAIAKIENDLQISFPCRSHSIGAEIDAFLQFDLRHHREKLTDLSVRTDIVNWVAKAFDWSIRAVNGDSVSSEELDAIHHAFLEADKAYGPVLARAKLGEFKYQSQLNDYAEHTKHLDRAIAQLNTKLEAKEGEITRLRTVLQGKEDEIARLGTVLETKKGEIASLGTVLETKENEIARLNTTLEAKEGEITRLETVIEGKENKIASLGTVLETKESEIARLNTKLEAKEEEIASLGTVLETKENEIARLETDLAVKEDENALLGTEVKSREQKIDQLNQKFKAQETNFVKLESGTSDRDRRLEELELEVVRFKSEIAQIQTSLTWKIINCVKSIGKPIIAIVNIIYWTITLQLLRKLREEKAYSVISQSGLFDTDYYLLTYPDVAKAGLDPLRHYLYFYHEGRNPSPNFNTKFYLTSNPDVAISKINPLFHYILYGQKEGRKAQN